MIDFIFDYIFPAFMAFQIILLLFGCVLCILIGFVLLLVDVYSHAKAKKVRAKIISVFISPRPNGDIFYPVYRYKNIEGELEERQGSDAHNSILTVLPGQTHTLMLMPQDKENIRKNSYMFAIIGFLVLWMGIFFLWQIGSTIEITIPFVLIIVFFAGYISFRFMRVFYKILEYFGGWNGICAAWREARKDKNFFVVSTSKNKPPENGFTSHAMTRDDIHRLLPRAKRQMKQYLFFLILTACGFGFFAQKTWLDTQVLLNHGLKTQGRVVDFDTSHGSDSTTYNAIVEFRSENGSNIRFKDKFGTSNPTLRTGQEVDVIYSRDNPQAAIIDRGIWNMAIPVILGVIAFFALWGVKACLTLVFKADQMKI